MKGAEEMILTTNKSVNTWVEEMIALTKPEKVEWIDGSEAQLNALRAQAEATGEIIKLNEEKLPNCFLHRTAINDVARVEDILLMKVKEENEKAGLKLSIQKTKIMASGLIISWQIDGEAMEQERLYFFWLQNHCRWRLQP